MGARLRTAVGACLVALLLSAPSAQAAFPGANGKIAFSATTATETTSEIYTINADGTGRTNITNNSVNDGWPAWSADGAKIAYVRSAEIWTMNADGSSQTFLHAGGKEPVWSPDGTKIVFDQLVGSAPPRSYIFVMNADGSGVTQLTHGESGDSYQPVWSPDGTKIAFMGGQNPPCCMLAVFLMNPDGSGQTRVTSPDSDYPDWSPNSKTLVFRGTNGGTCSHSVETIDTDGTNHRLVSPCDDIPSWSPDGTRIVADDADGQLYTMNPDGTEHTAIPNTRGGQTPDWQPIPITAYPRPKGASPTRVALVPAFKQCTSPNDTHGAPLSYGSCTPPVQASDFLTVGTPPQDPANSIGSVTARVTSGDAQLAVSITDVRNKTTLTDYSGELETTLPLRITDKDNIGMPGGGTAAGTTENATFSFAVPCATTADSTIGSACSVTTSADTLVPGAVTAGQRAIWQLGQVQVYDGGSDGIASTTADNTLFMDQGVFVP